MKLSTLLLALLAPACAVQAAVTFTFTGTITQDAGAAFELGETFTLSFTTNDDLGAPNILNDATGVRWAEDVTPGTQIWNTISISGGTGAYLTPAPGVADADLRSDGARPLYISAYTDSATTGLGIVRGGEELWFFEAWVDPAGTFASFGASDSVRADNTFRNGTYSVTTPFDAFFYTENYANEYRAAFDSLTITGSTIPEPASVASLFGLAALAAVCMHRRGRRRSD